MGRKTADILHWIEDKIEKEVGACASSAEWIKTASGVKDLLQHLLNSTEMFKSAYLLIYGSLLNSLVLDSSSDLDLCLVLPDSLGMSQMQVLKEVSFVFRTHRKNLEENFGLSIAEMMDPFWFSQGCILKLTLEYQGFGIKVEILVNKILEVRNSELLRQYALQDHRFRNICIVLKRWNRYQDED